MKIFTVFPIDKISKKLKKFIKKQNKLNNLINYYNECEILSLDIDPKIIKRYKAQLSDAKYQYHTQHDLSKVKNVAIDSTVIKSAEEIFEWYQRQNYNFFNNQTWLGYNDDHPDLHSKLISLESCWRLHGTYSHYTSTSLIAAANKLSEIEHEHHKILNKTKKSKKMIKKDSDYAKYLIETQSQISKEKASVTEAMFARLHLAMTTQDLTNHDVTVGLIDQLQVLNLTPPEKIIKKRLPHKMDSSVYTTFYDYIRGNGEGRLKARLSNLFILKDEGTLVGFPRQGLESQFFVPERFIKAIPFRSRVPAWLFKGHQLRYEFFNNRKTTELLLQLAAFSHFILPNTPKIPSVDDSEWKTLAKTQTLLQIEHSKARSSVITGFGARLRRQTNEFLSSWQSLLQQQRILVLENQIALLEITARKILPPFQHALEEPGLSLNAKQNIQVMMESIQSEISQLSLITNTESLSNLRQRFEKAKEPLTVLLTNDHKFSERQKSQEGILSILKHLNTGQPCTDEQWQLFLTDCEKISIGQKIKFNRTYKTLLLTLIKTVSVFFLSQPKKIREPLANDQNPYIAQCGKALRMMGTPQINDLLNNHVMDFLTRYPEDLKNLTPSELKTCNSLYEELEQTVDQFVSNDDQIYKIELAKLIRLELIQKSSSKEEGKNNTFTPIKKPLREEAQEKGKSLSSTTNPLTSSAPSPVKQATVADMTARITHLEENIDETNRWQHEFVKNPHLFLQFIRSGLDQPTLTTQPSPPEFSPTPK